MPIQSGTLESSNASAEIDAASHHIQQQLETLQRFMARRFDEISMEINATSQQVDMAESGLIGKFSEVLDVVQAISYSGGGKTAANAGVELSAVVEMTEQAAHKILDAAGHITTAIETDWNDPAARQAAQKSIAEEVGNIIIACSFQDLTSQRIRMTLENLKSIEDRLGNVLDKMGLQRSSQGPQQIIEEHTASSQADIDALFD